MRTAVLIVMLVAGGPALAGAACDAPKNDFDDLYCLGKIYEEADRELNINYQKLVPVLDAPGRQALRDGQNGWIEKRNADCSRRDASGFYVNMDCATRTTVERNRFIQDRLRECKSTGCLNSRL